MMEVLFACNCELPMELLIGFEILHRAWRYDGIGTAMM